MCKKYLCEENDWECYEFFQDIKKNNEFALN